MRIALSPGSLEPLPVVAVVCLAAPLLLAVPNAQVTDVRFVGKTKYLNNARAVVVHTIDDSTKLVVDTADAMDKYDIKGTFFISTEQDPPPEERFFNQLQVWLLWPRMQKAVENGHEVGAHAVTHPCSRPQSDTTSDTYKAFCEANYNDAELLASRDTILKRTTQPYVWTWAYPCGHCANLELIQKRIAAAGYIVARNYPGEALGLHIRPDLQTWASNPYDAPYTQVVQKQGGRRGAEAPPIDVPSLDAKFDEVYEKGGIYHFMSHPQSLDFGPDGFYEKHLRTSAVDPMSGTCRWVRCMPSRRLSIDRRPAVSNGGAQGPLRGLEHARSQDLQRQPHAGVHRAGRDLGPLRRQEARRARQDRHRSAGTRNTSAAKAIACSSRSGPIRRWSSDESRHVVGGAGRSCCARRGVAAAQDVAGAWNMSYATGDGVEDVEYADAEEGGRHALGHHFQPARFGRAGRGVGHGRRHRLRGRPRRLRRQIRIDYTGKVKGDTMTLEMKVGARDPIDVTAKRGQ